MNIRTRGALLLAAGAVPLALIALFLPKSALDLLLADAGKLAVFAMALPAALALTGLVELVSGLPFWRIAAGWDALQGWQRGMLGTLVVAAFIAGWFAGVMLFA